MTLKEFLVQRGYALPNTAENALNSRIDKVYWDGAQNFDVVLQSDESNDQFDFFVQILEEKFPNASKMCIRDRHNIIRVVQGEEIGTTIKRRPQ